MRPSRSYASSSKGCTDHDHRDDDDDQVARKPFCRIPQRRPDLLVAQDLDSKVVRRFPVSSSNYATWPSSSRGTPPVRRRHSRWDPAPDLLPKYLVLVGTRWYLLGLAAAPLYQRVPTRPNSHKHFQDSNSLGGTRKPEVRGLSSPISSVKSGYKCLRAESGSGVKAQVRGCVDALMRPRSSVNAVCSQEWKLCRARKDSGGLLSVQGIEHRKELLPGREWHEMS